MYFAFSVGVLSLGAAAFLASRSPGFHDQLHIWSLDETTTGRLALRVADTSHRVESLPSFVLDYVFSVFNLALAAFLIYLRRNERTARLLCLAMVGTAGVFNLQAHGVYEILPATTFESVTHDGFHLLAAVAYLLALLLFPDGRMVPRWSIPKTVALYAGAIGAAVPIAFLAPGGSRSVSLIVTFGVLTPMVGVGSQLYRYRRSPDATERQQARVLFWALSPALLVGLFAVVVALSHTGEADFEGRSLVVLPVSIFRVFQPVFSIIPIALFIGILRYRLWDIDKIISRTLVYSVLAGFVSAVYVGVVVGIGALFGEAQTENLGLSILATGIIAVAFQPVKERVQRFANRLVYGKRATPYEVLSEFSERMAETPATDVLVARMARILAEGTAARRADVWLRVGNELRPASSWPSDLAAPDALHIEGPEIPWIDNVTAAVAVRHQGELFGALSVTKPANESLTPTEEKLLADLGRQAGLVLRNVQLTADLLARLTELRASRQRLIAAQDETRRRLERNLHDGAQQQLVALKVGLSLAEGMAEDLGEEGQGLLDMLGSLKAQMGEALENLRDLARGIYPPLLAAEGLPAALASQARKAAVPVDVQARDIGRYDQDAEAAVYFCVLEALQNISKYAEAHAVLIRLHEEDDVLRFEVRDDGRGFDLATTPTGAGCHNMSDRLEALDGCLEIHSTPGDGTAVIGTLPVTRRVAS
ncbi:MAG TPA: histidine kinase [Acidimicrobiales bacterium]|nr:histidine kinase [Acidimicrobiales bacterium]